MMDKSDGSKTKTCVLMIRCVCEGCQSKIKLLLYKVDGVSTVHIDAQGGRVEVTGNFDPQNLTKKLEKSGKCSEMMEAQKSSKSIKSAAQSERSQSGKSKAGGSYKSQNSLKSGGEAHSHKGSKALTSASMENKSVKKFDLTDLESKRSGKSRGSEFGGGKNGRNGGLFGFGKFFGFGKLFGFGKNGGEKGPKPSSRKSHSERGGKTLHGGSIKKGSSRKDEPLPFHPPASDFHGSEVAHSSAGNSSVGRSSRGGSKKSSKKSQMSHHSGEKASQVDDISLVQDHEHSIARNSSVGRSSRGGSKKGSKRSPMSHHSGEKRSQMGDPYNQQDLHMTMMMNQRRYYDAPHRPTSPPAAHRESYEHYFSDENANACNIM